MRLIRLTLVLLPLLLPPALCRAQDPPTQIRSDVHGVRHDEAMEAAIARARETLPTFHTYLRRAADDEVFAQLKARFELGDEVEHMWVSDVSFKGGVYHGRLASTPLAETDLEPGDAVTIRPEEVTDWMVLVGDLMLGGFTVIEIRRRMEPEQREAFDKRMDYQVPDEAVLEPPRR